MKLHDLSLAKRVTIGVLTMVVAGTLTLLFIESARVHDAFISERRVHLANDLAEKDTHLKQTVNLLREDVLFLSNIPPVSGIMRATLNHGYDARDKDTKEKWENRLLGIFSAFSVAHPDYYKIRYLSATNGFKIFGQIDHYQDHIDITTHSAPETTDEGDFIKAALKLRQGQVLISKIDLRQTDGNLALPTLRAVTPIFTTSGQIFGVVVLNMDVSSLLRSVISDLPGIQTFMSNREGQYLLHQDSQQSFKFESGSKGGIASDFPFLASILDPQSADFQPLQAVATRAGNSFFSAKRIHFDPHEPSRFMLLMYYLPGNVVAQQVATIPADTLLYEFIVMLLVGGIAVLLLRRTFSPLKQITAVADQITAGNHDIRLPNMDGGEIGSLTSALNAMLIGLAQRENELKKSEASLSSTLNAIPDLLFELGLDGRYYSYHSPRTDLLAAPPNDLIGQLVSDALPPDAAVSTMAALQEANERGYSSGKVFSLTLPQGTRWFELSVARKPTIQNDEPRFIVLSRDITERIHSEQNQRQLSEQISRYADEIADLYEHAPCGYHSLDTNGVFQHINETELKWLGYQWDEIVGKYSLPDLLTPDSIVKFQQSFAQFKNTGEIRDLEMDLIRKDGTILSALISATAQYDADGNYLMSRSTIYDMTERKKMEQERFDYLKRLEEMSRHLVAAQEDARRRLSSELHDRTSPNLAAININLNTIATALPQVLSQDVAERLEDTRALIADTAASIREICSDMRPPLLDYAGLSAAAEAYANQFSRRTGIATQFDIVNREERYPSDIESLLFRIFQEALTNCAKHAHATSVTIAINNAIHFIELTITDDGIGFDPARLGKDGSIGLGVLNMREMAEVADGIFSLDSAPGKGTRIVVKISL